MCNTLIALNDQCSPGLVFIMKHKNNVLIIDCRLSCIIVPIERLGAVVLYYYDVHIFYHPPVLCLIRVRRVIT